MAELSRPYAPRLTRFERLELGKRRVRDYNKWRRTQKREYRRSVRRERQGDNNRTVSILGILVFVMLAFTLYKITTDQESIFTFERILQILQSSSSWTIDTSFIGRLGSTLTFTEEWAILDGFRVFLNTLGQIVTFAVWLVTGFINLLTFATSLLAQLIGFGV